MRLSKKSYYADFVIYAALLAFIGIAAILSNSLHGMSVWLLTAFIGVLAWTLIEYVLHRFVLHRIPPFALMHDAHHQLPLAFIGTSTWVSLGIICVLLFLPAWALGTLTVASGLAAGVMAGFLWYGIVHHAIHYRRPRLLARRLLGPSRRHALHHYARQPGNFAVTTAFWDWVFRTRLDATAERKERVGASIDDGRT